MYYAAVVLLINVGKVAAQVAVCLTSAKRLIPQILLEAP